MDLVDAVEWFNSEGTQQSYWSLPDTTRQEVKQYRQATRAANAPPTLPVVEETNEDGEVEEEVESTEPCDDLSQGVDDLTVHEGDEHVDDNNAEEDAPPPKRERSAAQKRYSDYLKIARRELKEADPSRTKIPHSEVHAHAKALLLEDGW